MKELLKPMGWLPKSKDNGPLPVLAARLYRYLAQGERWSEQFLKLRLKISTASDKIVSFPKYGEKKTNVVTICLQG